MEKTLGLSEKKMDVLLEKAQEILVEKLKSAADESMSEEQLLQLIIADGDLANHIGHAISASQNYFYYYSIRKAVVEYAKKVELQNDRIQSKSRESVVDLVEGEHTLLRVIRSSEGFGVRLYKPKKAKLFIDTSSIDTEKYQAEFETDTKREDGLVSTLYFGGLKQVVAFIEDELPAPVKAKRRFF